MEMRVWRQSRCDERAIMLIKCIIIHTRLGRMLLVETNERLNTLRVSNLKLQLNTWSVLLVALPQN